jgi:glutamate/tyrosine decarboxylase-like PLP-dependent enzyme
MLSDLKLFNDLTLALLADENENPVSKMIDPEDLYESLDFELNDEPSLEEDFKKNLKKLILSTPKTASKKFFNQLFGGRSSKAYLGELLAVMLNNSMYTYKVAGPQVGIEKTIIKKVADLIDFGDDADGTFAPGGSMSIFMAMIMARNAFNLDITKEGVSRKMTLYTSEESHYSVSKNASFIGVGRDNIRYIKADDQGRMLVSDLEEQVKKDIEKGYAPFYINATASTTVLGAFDPIEEISKIAKKYKIWLHVDGAFGGSVIFSKKYKHLIKGVEEADSFSFNPHKLLGTPLATSIIIAKRQKHLYDSFANEASYLYQTDGDELNMGKISIQCGRRNDALKFWTLWKSVGTSGLEKIVDNHFYLADKTRAYVSNNPNYTLYSFDDSVCVCFNYKGIPAEKICNELYESNEMMVGYGKFKEDVFIRMVFVNPESTDAELDNFFKILEEFSDKL